MKWSPKPARRLRKWLVAPALLLAVLAMSGCQTLSYYGQAIKGQYQIVAHQQKHREAAGRPANARAAQGETAAGPEPARLRREGLAAPGGRALREVCGLCTARSWFGTWRPRRSFRSNRRPGGIRLSGSLEYRGYFAEPARSNYAARLQKKGYDVYVGGVTAYSTLGWFKDPVLNTFIFDPEPDLAETLFHELGHQRVFASGDTDFNEAFATTVGQEGARRWLRAKGDQAALEKYLAELRRTGQFAHLITDTRERLEALYGDERTEEGKIKAAKKKRAVAARSSCAQQKQQLLDRLQQEYAQLKAQWGGDTEYDDWFARPVNNAQLNSVAAYYDLVPGFERCWHRTAATWRSSTRPPNSWRRSRSGAAPAAALLGAAAAG